MKLNSTAVVMGIALALFLGPRPAAAWTSGPEETPGPQEARNVWSWAKSVPAYWPWEQSPPANEHAELLKRAFEHAGLPARLFPSPYVPFEARVFTEGGMTNGGLPSFIPAPISNAKAIATRLYTLPGFAALPDHSYALWDWASGNERCPIDTVAGTDLDGKDPAVACHTFSSHLGILNSTHFPPQSEKTYRWYHELALKRAEECKTLNDNFSAAFLDLNDDQRGLTYHMVTECEREALVIEAVGQHFLQDAWAMGHMWERWGTPFLSGFTNVDGSSSIKEERRARGVFVAAVAGLIHGADSLLRKVPFVEGGDQMNYGRSRDVTWRQPGDPRFEGIGDIYADLLFSDSYYAIQSDMLLGCSASGVLEVYRKTAMVSGEASGRATVNPVGPECFSQRATNLAIWEGLGILTDPNVTSLITGGGIALETVGSTTKSALLAELRTEMTKLAAFVRSRKDNAPTGVDLANSGLSRDGFFMITDRNGLLTQYPPAPYADPQREDSEPNPSHLQDPDTHGRYIARVFNKAHVADWCIDSEADPEELRKRVESATPAETPAAYEACVEFTERHVRLGSMPSICDAATKSVLPYSFVDTTGATDIKTAAARFCAPAISMGIYISGGAGYSATGGGAPIVEVFSDRQTVGTTKEIGRSTQLYSNHGFDVTAKAVAGVGVLHSMVKGDVEARSVLNVPFQESLNANAIARYHDEARFSGASPSLGEFGYWELTYYVPFDLEVPTSPGYAFNADVLGTKQYGVSYLANVAVGLRTEYEVSPGEWHTGITKSFEAFANSEGSAPVSSIPSDGRISFRVPMIIGAPVVIDANLAVHISIYRSGSTTGDANGIDLSIPGALVFADASRSLYFEKASILDANGNDLQLDMTLMESSLGLDYSKSLVPASKATLSSRSLGYSPLSKPMFASASGTNR